MGKYETIRSSLLEGNQRITPKCPDGLNAFNEKMTSELHDALKTAKQDSSVRYIVAKRAG